jgi:hypothetical protein
MDKEKACCHIARGSRVKLSRKKEVNFTLRIEEKIEDMVFKP